MNIQELKLKSSEQLITQAEELGIENASTLRKQEILFAILKKLAEKNAQMKSLGVTQGFNDKKDGAAVFENLTYDDNGKPLSQV